MSQLSTQGSSTESRRRSHWPMAVALIVLALCGTFLIVYAIERVHDTARQVAQMPANMIAGLAGAFRPQVNVTTQIDTAIGQLKHNPKLVVLTADVDAEVTKSSATSWGYLYFGTTEVRIRAHGNKVQWYVPMDTLGTSDFVYDPVHQRLTLYVPPPRLDEDVVSVQSNPSQVELETKLGWAKFDRWSGAPLRDDARRDLRPAVIQAGKHALLRTQARVNAKEHIKRMLAPMGSALEKDVEIDVEFRE